MNINPYFYFNGNAAEAISLYEKAFNTKAIVAKYKDAVTFDKTYVIPQGLEDLVMHSNMKVGGNSLMICDVPPATTHNFGNGLQLMLSLSSEAEVRRVFETLKEGGAVIEDLQKAFWSDCYGSLKDKFGVHWLLSYENPTQVQQTYGE